MLHFICMQRDNNEMSLRGEEIIVECEINEQNTTFSQDEDEYYALVKVLGRGAFGEAVLYRKKVTNELVVWKEINLNRGTDRDRDDALNEVEILSQLYHNNIIAYYNDFFDGTSLFIEMEYANGGTLHHKIVDQKGKLFSEKEVLTYWYQLLSAVSYIHNFSILHRDIKTLNIFLMKNKIVKLGDFGISKVLDETHGNAKTCVGTPYYMSPELVQGNPYNEKSDVWACGCVLYELLTLQKVFQASNQLRLIVSILEHNHGEVSNEYSKDIRDIVSWTLNKEADMRPTTDELLCSEIFKEVKHLSNAEQSTVQLNQIKRTFSQRSVSSQSFTAIEPIVSTVTSDVFYWGGGKEIPQKLDMFHEENAAHVVSAGFCHFAVVTIQKELFTWANIQGGGTNIVGQLGHGNLAMYRNPKKVSFFVGTPVKHVVCGLDFTVILSEVGQVYACGSDYYGCIGCDNAHGDVVVTPVEVQALNDVTIVDVSCGDSHVVALTSKGSIYTWGCGEDGRLGLGNEDDYSTPQLVPLEEKYNRIVKISCGRDNTFILTSNGHLLAFGSNEYNKMGLNQIFRFKSNAYSDECIVHYSLSATPVRALRSYRLVSVAAGESHSAVVDEFGRLLTFGNNEYGQLGLGDYRQRKAPCLVKGNLSGKTVKMCHCGDRFTVVATEDNQLFSWGSSENGRLGVKLLGKDACSLPKAVFGSLQEVVRVSCRYWNTILLAEQVLTSKTMQMRELSVSEDIKKAVEENECSFKFNEDAAVKNEMSSPVVGNDDRSTNHLPPWLEEELEHGEFIPIDTKHNDPLLFREESITSESGACLKCLSRQPNVLELRIQELEMEQLRLKKLLQEKELLVEALRKEKDCYIDFSQKLVQLNKSSSTP